MNRDMLMAMEMSLLAAGYKPKPKGELKIAFPEILQELLDYVNSPQYQELIIKEKKDHDARRHIGRSCQKRYSGR